MLKFVTTKPPRGRSSSGSGTPDRQSSHEASPSRTHYSPRFIRKHYSSSQAYGYPDNSRAPFPSSVPSSPSLSYRPLPSSSRGYFVTPSPPIAPKRRSEKSKTKRRFTAPDPRPFMPSEPQYQELPRPAPTLYELQQQEYLQQQQQQQQGYQPQVQAQPQQQQQHQQQRQQPQQEQQQQPQAPWSKSKYSYKQATPSESSGNYATLQYKDPYAGYVGNTSSLGRKFPLEIEGLYNAKGEVQPSPAQGLYTPKLDFQQSSVESSRKSSVQSGHQITGQSTPYGQQSSVENSRKSSIQSGHKIPIQNVQQLPVQGTPYVQQSSVENSRKSSVQSGYQMSAQSTPYVQQSSVENSRKSSIQSGHKIPIQNVQQLPVHSGPYVQYPPSASESPYSTLGSRSSRDPLTERHVFNVESSQPGYYTRSGSETTHTSRGVPPPKEVIPNIPDNQLVPFGAAPTDQYPAETTEEVFPDGGIRTIKQQIPGGEFRKISSYQISPAFAVTPDFDVSKDIPDLNDPIIAKQIAEQLKGPSLAKQYGQPVTTQFIINETITRKKDTTKQVPYGMQDAGGQQQKQLPSTVQQEQQQQSVQKQQQQQQHQTQQQQQFSSAEQSKTASAVQQEVSFTEKPATLPRSQKAQPPTPTYTQEQSVTQAPSYHSPPATRRNVEYMEKTTEKKKEAPPPVKPKPDRSKVKAVQSPVTHTETQQVMTSCVPQVTNDLSNEALNKNQSSMRSAGMSSQTPSTMSSTMRDMLNKSQEQAQIEGALNLDVVYITERIISMTFPSEGHDTTYSFNLKEVVRMLKTKHGDNYLILNLSEKRQDLTKANPQVKEYGWPDHLAPPLERLCSLCKAIDSWLNADVRNVVVLHCKGGRSRIASVIAAYMHYSNICASADQALDRFAMKRFYDDKLGGLPLPSQRRYVRYFSGLLSGTIKINSNPLYLHHILIHGVPNFDTKGGCRPFIKVYQGMQPIFTSGVYNVTDNMQKVCISISPGIPLRGDILIKCYHKKTRSGQREVMWQCQFHTCAISDNNVVFSKQELDDAIMDPRFPDNGKVEFVFGPSSDVLVSVSGFKSDVTVPVDDNEESLARSDSYENFHRALEALDGYAGHNTSFSQHYTSSATSNNINNNISSSEVINPSYASQAHQQQNQSNSTLGRKTVQTLEERTQLDELLSDLLSEQAYVSPNQRSPRSFQTAVQSQQAPISPGSNVTTSPTMSSAKTVTTTTRTFTSYSSSDSHRNPDKVLIQRAEVSYKVPGQGEVKDHYTIAADPSDVLQTSPPSRPPHSYHPKGVPNNAFSYTAGLSSTQQSSNTQRAEVVEHEVIRSPVSQNLQSPPSSRLPYRPDYEPRMDTSNSSYSYSSLDADSNSWLAQQQQKLKNFKEGRDSSGRTEQEKKLVNELRFAQNKYYTRREQNEEEERTVMDSYNRQALHNGPTSPERVTPSYAAPQRSQSSSAVDGPWPQDQFYNTSYSTSSYMESRSYGDKRSNKPPPSPTMQRSIPPSSAPVPVPARSSSKEYMRTRSNSSSTNWQQQQPQRPLQRQQSDTLYDRNIEPIQPRSYGSTHSTPPHSPRAISPSGPHSTTTYTTYRTIEREREKRQIQDDMQRAKRVQQQQAPPPVQQPPPVVNHHYITEVFVHRTDMNKDKTDSSTRLDELEKNLEAASQSIKASKSSQNYAQAAPPQPQQQIIEESMSQHSQSRQFHTYQDTKPEPPRVKEIEEDRIMLRPIGPGMQTLEPESAHQGTLGRPTTPGFPTGPDDSSTLSTQFGGSHIISPTGTLQQAQQHQPHQTIQYQQYQSQQYQTQSAYNDGQGQGTLHIDTSPKMLIAPRSPSAGSPPSPGNFNTLRQQLSSAHSMSGSVVSPGPHSMTGQSSPSVYFGLSRRGSLSSLADSDMVHTTPKFVKDTSKYWYKPNITREEAIQMLKDKQPGTFVIRDSNSFPGAFGLALKVATIPPNVQAKPSGDPQADLVRHFLIEPTPKGVRLRGCSNEPVFGSLAALVYQHSITPLALPCKLALPEGDVVDGLITPESPMSAAELNSAATLLAQGAACNVIFINSVDMESLTGPQAVAKAVKMSFENLVQGRTTMVHFKVSNQGITLTDNNRKLFFRRHYPVTAVTYCGMDPQDRRWKREIDAPGVQGDARIFGFVARKQGSSNENSCHIFAELDPEQPASAIVNFVTKVMIGQSKVKS